MGRPPLPDHIRRTKMLPIRLSVAELAQLERGAGELGITVADLLRKGAALYLRKKSKDGHRKQKETQR
jgi:hypothetical protein